MTPANPSANFAHCTEVALKTDNLAEVALKCRNFALIALKKGNLAEVVGNADNFEVVIICDDLGPRKMRGLCSHIGSSSSLS